MIFRKIRKRSVEFWFSSNLRRHLNKLLSLTSTQVLWIDWVGSSTLWYSRAFLVENSDNKEYCEGRLKIVRSGWCSASYTTNRRTVLSAFFIISIMETPLKNTRFPVSYFELKAKPQAKSGRKVCQQCGRKTTSAKQLDYKMIYKLLCKGIVPQITYHKVCQHCHEEFNADEFEKRWVVYFTYYTYRPTVRIKALHTLPAF